MGFCFSYTTLYQIKKKNPKYQLISEQKSNDLNIGADQENASTSVLPAILLTTSRVPESCELVTPFDFQTCVW